MVSFQALSPDVSGLLTFEEVGITYKAIKLLWRRHASESVCCWQTTFEEVCASGGMKGKQLGAAAVASLVALDHIHLDHERNLITPGAKWGTTSPRAASKETLPKSTGGAAAPAASDSASMSATSLFPSLGAETAFEFNAARVVLAKDTSAHERKNKCERCWKTVNGASLCLCTKVQQLMASPEGDLWRNSGQPRWCTCRAKSGAVGATRAACCSTSFPQKRRFTCTACGATQSAFEQRFSTTTVRLARRACSFLAVTHSRCLSGSHRPRHLGVVTAEAA